MKKPQLLLIHGFRGSHEGLIDIAVWLLDSGYECYYPDIPPVGKNKTPRTDYPPDSYAQFIADYIKDNDLDHPVLIGHSMGSIIAAATAEKYPDIINEKLILLAPISNKPPRAIASLQPLVTVLPNKLVGYLTTKFLIIPKDKKLLRETLDLTYKCSEYYTSKPDVRASAKFSADYSIADFNFDKDTLLLVGEKDRLIAKKVTENLAKNRNFHVKFMKNTGHLLNYENPKGVAEEIEKFLSPVI
ncbi:alpha/beta hydrolase [Candidatus Saccharibacteria bacterium]|nr:alpha/beta hydrolase [Candidatus Saccharibacteria bacterium]